MVPSCACGAKGGDAPPRGHALAAARSPSTARQCVAWQHRARRPAAHRPDPSARARDRPAPEPATPPDDRTPPRLHARPRRVTRPAAAAAPPPASGSRSTAARAPRPPTQPPRRRLGLPSPSGLPRPEPTQLSSPSSTEPFPLPPWTSDSPLIRVQENRGRLIWTTSHPRVVMWARSVGTVFSLLMILATYGITRRVVASPWLAVLAALLVAVLRS